MSQRWSLDNIRDFYPADKYILLLPSVTKHIMTDNPMWALDVAEVEIDPENKAHCYPQKTQYDQSRREYVPTEVSLTKMALDLLAAAADLSLVVKRTDDKSTSGYCCHEAFAVLKTPGGDLRTRSMSCEWEGDLEQEKVQLSCENYVMNAIRREWKGYKNLTEPEVQRAIDTRFRGEWIREREYGKRKNESKASNRAIAAILACQRTYPIEMLRGKKFAVAKFVLAPDLSDPAVRDKYIEAGMRASSLLFAQSLADTTGTTFLPSQAVQAPVPVAALPEARQEPDPIPKGPAIVPDTPSEGEGNGSFDPPVKATSPEGRLITISSWDSPEIREWVPKVGAALIDWTGDEYLKSRVQTAYENASSKRDYEAMEYIINHLIGVGVI